MRFATSQRLLSAAVCFALAPAASAQLSPYSQDFESLLPGQANFTPDPADDDLANDGWMVFGQLADPTGASIIPNTNYGPFVAPNTDGAGFAFSAVKDAALPNPVESHVTPAQGTRHLNIANDYQNPSHSNGSNNVVVSSVFQSQIIGAGNSGQTWSLTFDATLPNNAFNFVGPSSPTNRSLAFMRIIDPNNPNVAPTILGEFDASNLNDQTWQSQSFTYTFNGADVGKELQFGFETRAANGSPTGTFYDNIEFFEGVPGEEGPEGEARSVPMPLAGLVALGVLLAFGGLAVTRRNAG